MSALGPPGRFLEFGDDPEVLEFLAGMARLRAGIVIDPMIAEPWSCDPDACRPVMGPNLCCKVDIRCRHFDGLRCLIHVDKPFSCALFPLDLWRAGGLRAVISAKNPIPYAKDWSRYDRDMLGCFSRVVPPGPSMFEAQEHVLAEIFTVAEMNMIAAAVDRIKTGST